jgi:hypothetical protein
MSHVTAWLTGIAVTLVIELLLVWRISRALSTGTIKIDPLFWLADTFGFDFTVSRATNPIMYWLGTLAVMGLAFVVLAVFVLVAAINIRG